MKRVIIEPRCPTIRICLHPAGRLFEAAVFTRSRPCSHRRAPPERPERRRRPGSIGHWRALLIGALLIGAALAGPTTGPTRLRAAAAHDDSGDYWSRREALDAAYAARLEGLARRCDELKLHDAATVTRRSTGARDPRRQTIFLPREVDATKPAADAPQLVQQWHARFSEYRRAQADALLELARSELQAQRPTQAYQLLHEILYTFPDHEAVRKMLGYRLVEGRWRVPEAAIRARRSPTANPELAFDAGRHWVIESEHFRVTTDHSEAEGIRLAERLEALHAVWQQVFFSYWSNAALLARRFDGATPIVRNPTRHRAVLFRDRDAYLQRVSRLAPQLAGQLELTQAIYLEAPKTAYFHASEQPRDDLYFHEVTHQLFSETGRAVPQVAMTANMWIVEGVALYMESLQIHEGCCTVGGVDANRLQYARYRTLSDGFHVPLDQLTALGRQAWQRHADIRLLYTEAAGLAAFLMDFDRGRYRPLLDEYLQAVYRGRDDARTLATLVGTPLSDLDAQYRTFLNVTDDDLAFVARASGASMLALGRTSITDRGLGYLAGLTRLEWLDLAHTAVTDAGIEHLRGLRNLESLDISGTAVTAAGFERLKQALPRLATEQAGP